MDDIDRRTALGLGLAAVSIPAIAINPAAADTTAGTKDKELGPGVVERMYGQVPSMIDPSMLPAEVVPLRRPNGVGLGWELRPGTERAPSGHGH